ncbi:conserved Plasmodium protein, unknown function [Plasmodium gallinaceum]|uniref:Uncharacterized protein n=1 Tax=Plasmodium gallinaceum TaxID=5849 RepID=A0A1J1GYH2_PLAGA|nr:conserved Plasmodium protein, unknown function [Plasmodium gallinaceum]CRG97612.1 conserved Plasmodium protein, unknown function [Plasmodium gallinaceum]
MNLFHLDKKEKYSIEHYMGKQRNNFLILKDKNKKFEDKINKNKTKNFKKYNIYNTKNLNCHKFFFNSSKTESEMNKNKSKKKIKMMGIKNKQTIGNCIYRKNFEDSKLNAKKNNKSKKYKRVEKSGNYFPYDINSDSCDTYNKSEVIDNKNYKLKFKKSFEKNKLNNEHTKKNILSNKLNSKNIELKFESSENDKLSNISYYHNIELKDKKIQNDNLSHNLNYENVESKNQNDQNDQNDQNVNLSDSNYNIVDLKLEDSRNVGLSIKLNKNNIDLKYEQIENTNLSNIMGYESVGLKLENTENIDSSKNLDDILEKENCEFSKYTFDKCLNEEDLKKNDIFNNNTVDNNILKNKLSENEYIIENEENKCEHVSFYNTQNINGSNFSNYILRHEKNYDFNNNLNQSNNNYNANSNINNLNYKMNNMNEENHLKNINEINNIKKLNSCNEVNNLDEINTYNNINNLKEIKSDGRINNFSCNKKVNYVNYSDKHINNENQNNNFMNNDFFNQNIPHEDNEVNGNMKNINNISNYNKYIHHTNNQYFKIVENKIGKGNINCARKNDLKNDSITMEEGNDNMIYKDEFIHENVKDERYIEKMKNINMNLKRFKLNKDDINILEKSRNISEQNDKDMFFSDPYNTINDIKSEIEDNIYCDKYDEKTLGNMKSEMKGNYICPIDTSNSENVCEVNDFSKKNCCISVDFNNLNYMKNNYIENACDSSMYELTDYYNHNFINGENDNKLNTYHSTNNLSAKNTNNSDDLKTEIDYNKNIETQNSNSKNEKRIKKCNNLCNDNFNDDYNNNNLNFMNENENNNYNTDEYDTEIEEMKLKKKEFKKMILNNKSEFTTINENDELYKTVLYIEKKNKKILKMRRSLRRKRKLKRLVSLDKDNESPSKNINNDITYNQNTVAKNEEFTQILDNKNEGTRNKNILEDNMMKQKDINNNYCSSNNNIVKNNMEIEKSSTVFTNHDNNNFVNKIKMNEKIIHEKDVNNKENYENRNLLNSSSGDIVENNNVNYITDKNYKKKNTSYEPKKSTERKYKKLKSNGSLNKYKIIDENKLNNNINLQDKYYTNNYHSSVSILKKYEKSDSEQGKNNNIEKYTVYRENEFLYEHLNDMGISNYDIKEEKKKNISVKLCNNNDIVEPFASYEENLRDESNDNYEENNEIINKSNNIGKIKMSRRTLRDRKEKSKKDDDYIYDDEIFNEKIKKRRNKFKNKNTLKKNRKFCENKFDFDITNSQNILENNETLDNDQEKINEQKKFLTDNLELINEYLKQNKLNENVSKENNEEKEKDNLSNKRNDILINKDLKNISSGNLLDADSNTNIYNEANGNLMNIKKDSIIQIINSNLLGVKSIDSSNQRNEIDFKSKRKQKRSVKIYRVHKNRTETPLEKKLRIKICLEDYYKRNKEIYNNINTLSSINDINLPSIEDENFNDNLTILLKKKKKNLICSNCLYAYKVQISKRNDFIDKNETEDNMKCNEMKEKKIEKIKATKKRYNKKNKDKGEDSKDINDSNHEVEEDINLHEKNKNEKYMDINSYKELVEKNILAENYCKITFYCLCGYFKYIKEDDEWKQIINCYYDEKEELKPKAPYIFCIKCKELLITNRFLDKDKTKIIMICECGSRNYDRVNFFWVRRGNIKQRKAPQILCEECHSKMWVHTWLDDIGSKVKLLCKCGFKNFLKKNNSWVRSPRWKKPVPLIICNSCQQKMYMSQWLNNDGTKVKMKCECGWKTLIKEGNTWVRSEWSKKLLCLRLVKNPHLLQKKYNIHSRRKNKSVKNDSSDGNNNFVLKNETSVSMNGSNNNEVIEDELNNTLTNCIKKDKNYNGKIKKTKSLKNTAQNEEPLIQDENFVNNNSVIDMRSSSNVDINENEKIDQRNSHDEILLNQRDKLFNKKDNNISKIENYINFKQNDYNNLSKKCDYNSNSEENETTIGSYSIVNNQEKCMVTNQTYDTTKYEQENIKTNIGKNILWEERNFELNSNDNNKRSIESTFDENKDKENNNVFTEKLKNSESYPCSLICDGNTSNSRRYEMHQTQDRINNINENSLIETINNNDNLNQNSDELNKNSINRNSAYDFYNMKNMNSEDKGNNDFNKMYFENSYYYVNNYYDRYDKNYYNQNIPFNENNYNENNDVNVNFYENFIPNNQFHLNNNYAVNYNINTSLESFHDKKYVKNDVLSPQSYDKKKFILENIKKFDNNINEIDVNSILENLDEEMLIETFIENLIDKNEIEKNKMNDNEVNINEMYQNKMYQDSMCNYEIYQNVINQNEIYQNEIYPNGIYQNGIYPNELYQNEFYQNIIENTFNKNEINKNNIDESEVNKSEINPNEINQGNEINQNLIDNIIDKNEINKNEINQNLIDNLMDKNEINKNIINKNENNGHFNSDKINKNDIDRSLIDKNSRDKNSADENMLKENLTNDINNSNYSNNYKFANDLKTKEKYNNEVNRNIEGNVSLKNVNNHEINSNDMCNNNVENADMKNFENNYYKNSNNEKKKKSDNILNNCNFQEESQYFNNEFKNIIDHIFSDKNIENETFNDYVKNVAYNFCKSLNKNDNVQNNKEECNTNTCEEDKTYLKEDKIDEEMKNYKDLSFSINDHANSFIPNNFCNEFNFYENIMNLQKLNGEMENDLSSYKSHINDITPEKHDLNEMHADYNFNSDNEEKICSHEKKYKINDFITICKNCHEYINHIDYKMLSSNNLETEIVNKMNIDEENTIQDNDLKNYDESVSEKKEIKTYNENAYNSLKMENNISLNYIQNQNECNNNYSGNNSNQSYNNNFSSIENMEEINHIYNQYCDFYINNSIIDDVHIKNNYLGNFFFQEQNNYSSNSEHFTNNQTPIKNENFYFSEDNNYLSDSTNYINTKNFSNKEVSSKDNSYKENNSNDNNNCDDNYQENYSNYINSECNNNSCYNIIHI